MNKRLIVLSLVVFGAAVFVSSAQAQRHAAFTFAPESRTGRAVSAGSRANFVRARHTRRYFAGSAFASPFYSDYSDYDSEPENFDEPPSPFIARTTQPLAAVPNPAESLVLELQGDHWVRLTNYGQSQTGQILQSDSQRASSLTSSSLFSASRQIHASEPPSELPPAVLVFRDGHQEEIGKYVIAGATIYTSADYWSSGWWTRKVQIAALDIPATLKVNRERGAKFSLPSGPHEVMIRP
jgi:hypothetical protein